MIIYDRLTFMNKCFILCNIHTSRIDRIIFNLSPRLAPSLHEIGKTSKYIQKLTLFEHEGRNFLRALGSVTCLHLVIYAMRLYKN